MKIDSVIRKMSVFDFTQFLKKVVLVSKGVVVIGFLALFFVSGALLVDLAMDVLYGMSH